MESGSNDPVAYLLTMIGIMMKTGGSLSSLPYMIFAQVVFGLAIGAAAASPWHSFTEKGNDAGSRHGYDPCDRPGDDCLRFI